MVAWKLLNFLYVEPYNGSFITASKSASLLYLSEFASIYGNETALEYLWTNLKNVSN